MEKFSFEDNYALVKGAFVDFCARKFHTNKPLLISGRSGSGKSHLVHLAKELLPGKIFHILPPTKDQSFEEKIGEVIASQYAKVMTVKEGEKPDLREFTSMTFVIDEAHKLVEQNGFDFEGVQEGEVFTSFGGVKVLFRQLVFMSYRPLVDNASERARVKNFDLGSPDRDYMVKVLEGTKPYKEASWLLSKPLLTIAAKYSPRNLHELRDNAIALMEGHYDRLHPYGVAGVTRQILEKINGKTQIGKISSEVGIDRKDYLTYEEPLWFDSLITTSDKKPSIRILTELGSSVLGRKSREASKGLTQREKARVASWERRWAKQNPSE